MTKARDIADLLDATGDVKSTALDNVPASDDASALTTGTLDNARLPSNISDSGTEGTKLASGTTAQRGSTTGQIRFNSTTGLAEYYTGTIFKSIDSPPTISSIDITEVDSQAGGNQTIVITGSSFNSGATVTFVGNAGTDFTASTVTVDSDTQITAVAPKVSFLNAQEPYGVKVTNTSGLSATLASQINVDTSPSWSTASGSLGEVGEGSSVNVSATATDADGDTIVYSETGGTVISTNSLTLNSASGAITGTAPTVSGDTLLNFTLRASANSKTSDRAFSINILNTDGSTQARATEDLSNISYDYTDGTPHKKWVIVNNTAKNVYVKNHNDGWYWVCTHTFGGTNTLTTTNSDVLIRAGTYYTTENLHNATNDNLRFSDNSNSYVTGAVDSSFWAMEGTANPYDSTYGSNQSFFNWWAHSSSLGRLHVYGDLSSVVPSGATHGLWKLENQGSAVLQITNHDGTNVGAYGLGFTPNDARFSLGTLSNTGTHGSQRDGDGQTNRVYELWVGHQ